MSSLESHAAFTEVRKSSKSTVSSIKATDIFPNLPSNSIDITEIHMRDNSCNSNVNADIYDSECIITDNDNQIDIFNENEFLNNCGATSDFSNQKNDTKFKDSDFLDAVNFFKDNSPLNCLEYVSGSNASSESSVGRSSLYQKFDPLYTKFPSSSNMISNELHGTPKDQTVTKLDNFGSSLPSLNIQKEFATVELQRDTMLLQEVAEKLKRDMYRDTVKRHLSNEYSPKFIENSLKNRDKDSDVENEKICDFEKIPTDEKMLQDLKIEKAENVGCSSSYPESSISTSSLYKKFDALDEKTFSQRLAKTNELKETGKYEINPKLVNFKFPLSDTLQTKVEVKLPQNNILLEVESEILNKNSSVECLYKFPDERLLTLNSILSNEPTSHGAEGGKIFNKTYTEDDMQQELKFKDLTSNITYDSQSCAFSDRVGLPRLSSSLICLENDSAFTETFNSSKSLVACFKGIENSSETTPKKLSVSQFNMNEYAINRKSDSGIHTSENEVYANVTLIDSPCIERKHAGNNDIIFNFIPENDTEFKDENYIDTSQSLKDLPSLEVLDGAGSRVILEASMTGSSLGKKFDPLHTKSALQANTDRKPIEIQKLALDNIVTECKDTVSMATSDNPQPEVETKIPNHTNDAFFRTESDEFPIDSSHDNLNKCASNESLQKTVGNLFDLITNENMDYAENGKICDLKSLCTEDEMQQLFKNQNNTLMKTYELQNSFFSSVKLSVDCASPKIFPERFSSVMEPSSSSDSSVCCIKPSATYSVLPLNYFNATHSFTDKCANRKKNENGIHESESNIVENEKPTELCCISQSFDKNCAAVNSNPVHENVNSELKDEKFIDGVQFFKDPPNFAILENAASTFPSESPVNRSSLYEKFDPLYAKFISQTNTIHEIQETEKKKSNVELGDVGSAFALANIPNEIKTDKLRSRSNNVLMDQISDKIPYDLFHDIDTNNSMPDILFKHDVDGVSLGKQLTTFESSVINKNRDTFAGNEKVYELKTISTEDEFQQALKVQSLIMQEAFLKKQQRIEECFTQKQQILDAKMNKQMHLSNSLYVVLKEVVNIVYVLDDKEKTMKKNMEIERNKFIDDLKIANDDVRNFENTFSELCKRYNQCKNVLKKYAHNENILKEDLKNVNVKLHEKEEMYIALKSRTEEILNKTNTEIDIAKKSGDAQVAVLNAQLGKAEMKISSLESDLKHMKIENEKLSKICDELMDEIRKK